MDVTTQKTPSLRELALHLSMEGKHQDAESFLEVAQCWLAQPLDWATIVADHIESLDPMELCALAIKGAIADSVPRVILLHEYCNGNSQIVLHHFEGPLWQAHFKSGRFRPHHHSRPFAVRLLTGGYHHLTYRPDTDGLNLTPVHEIRVLGGDLYALTSKTYHFVGMPEHNTLTLSVRGPVEEELNISADARFDQEALLILRDRLVSLLRIAPHSIPLRQWDFEGILKSV